jgi:hypothetical protein
VTDFELHLRIWGCFILGPSDPTVAMSEIGGYGEIRMWDQPKSLDSIVLNGDRPPDWMACYWIGEHIRRGHAVFPGQ